MISIIIYYFRTFVSPIKVFQIPQRKLEPNKCSKYTCRSYQKILDFVNIKNIFKKCFRCIEIFYIFLSIDLISYKLLSKADFKSRFDDMSARATRKDGEQGRIAPIHELWEKFIEACKKNYSAGPYVTIDESLLAFRGRCSFNVYMPSKPCKYGIEVWSMVDASNAYLLNAQIYKGKGLCGPERH